LLPAPRFIVFYNGTEKQPERKILRLSESFHKTTDEINLELVVLQLNINPGYNEDLMANCRTLHDYMQYVEKVRRYSRQMDFADAVEQAVSECISEGILEEFLRENRAEVIQMSIFEYDEELHMETLREEGRLEGIKTGIKKGRTEGREEGIKVGRTEGVFAGKQELIANMLNKNLSPEQICELTNEPLAVVQEVQNTIR
jgi:predicted transposase YdaD